MPLDHATPPSTDERDEAFRHALAAWNSDAVLGPPLGAGNRNDVRLVRLHGRRYAGRLGRRSAEAMDWELDLLEHLARHGMVVPLPQRSVDGQRRTGGLVVFSWLDGYQPVTAGDWRAVAAQLTRLHQLTAGWPQRPGFRSTQDLLHEQVGGDVRLDLMPRDAVRRCRTAWRALRGLPLAVVHGDPGTSNIRLGREGVGFIDWDEARVDVTVLDFAGLPAVVVPIDGLLFPRVQRASDAWEAANGWLLEPAYARERLARLPPLGALAETGG